MRIRGYQGARYRGSMLYVIARRKYPRAEARYFGNTDGLRRIDSSSEEGENDIATSAQPRLQAARVDYFKKGVRWRLHCAGINSRTPLLARETWRNDLTWSCGGGYASLDYVLKGQNPKRSTRESRRMVSRSRGIDLALWHDRHFRPIFRRLFLYTSNSIATERSVHFAFLSGWH